MSMAIWCFWAIVAIGFAAFVVAIDNKPIGARVSSLRDTVRASLYRRAVSKACIDIDKQCPGCGHRSGTIKTDTENRCIAHRCNICGAEWGEAFVTEPNSWLGLAN